jgi:ABC-type uncharacterized transport system permease subunit
MRPLIVALAALVLGFLAGVFLSSLIETIGYLGFGQLVGIRSLPLYLATICALGVPLVDLTLRRRADKPAPTQRIARKTGS